MADEFSNNECDFMNELQQLKAILDGAPDGATHYSETANGFNPVQSYLKYDCGEWNEWYDSSFPHEWDYCSEDDIDEFNEIHSISDIRRIVELLETKEE